MDTLPFIDEHAVRIARPAEVVWTALLTVLRRTMREGTFTWALGCEPSEATIGFTGVPGDTIPGFRVADAERGRRLVLAGRHRFSDYRLTFVFDGAHLRAQTHAAFPRLRGRLYRAAVIGSGAHGIVTKHLLRQVARSARALAG
ncbi:MAG: hypothetical protein ABW252_00870 [Polyangiales bacterium]